MRLDEFREIDNCPKHSIPMFSSGVILIILAVIMFLTTSHIIICGVTLLIGIRIYHFSYMGYVDLLLETYYTYLPKCRQKRLDIRTFKLKCIERFNGTPMFKRYCYTFYKSNVRVLHHLLTFLSFVVLLSGLLCCKVAMLDIQCEMITKVNYTKSYDEQTSLLNITQNLLGSTMSDAFYEVIYPTSVYEVADSLDVNNPQLGVVGVTYSNKKFRVYVDIFTSQIVACDQYFEEVSSYVTTYVLRENVSLVGGGQYTYYLLDKYPRFRVATRFEDIVIY